MKWRIPATALAALTLVLVSSLAAQPPFVHAELGLDGAIASTELINFYGMTTTEVTTFVQLLQTQRIPLFIVRLNAFAEWQSGSSSGVTKAKQVITAANSRGIEVAVDLHTWYTTWDNYFRDDASSCAANRAKYITYVKTVLTAFAGSNVYAFMVMNEPQARTASSSENQFILNVIAAARGVTDRPVSVRFMAGYSPSTGHYSATIDQASDFLCRNTYWDARYPTQTVYGASQTKLLTALNTAHTQDKPYWITEFGKSKSNLENQRDYVEAFITWARSKGVDAVFCWVSQPEGGDSEVYNIFNGYTPYPAFYELTGGVLPPEDEQPPPEPLPEPDILFEDSFESGTLDCWTGTGTTYGETVTVTDTQAYEGTQALCCAKTGGAQSRENAFVYKNIGDVSDAYANGCFYIDDSAGSQILTDPGDITYFLRLSDDSAQALASAGIQRDSTSTKWILSAGGTTVTAPITLSADRWYNIELHWNADKALAEMFVEGTRILQITAEENAQSESRYVHLGLIAASQVQDQLTIYSDSFKLATSYLGPPTAGLFPPWDINQDGTVDLLDVTITCSAYGSTPNASHWDPRADANSDGAVDLHDMVLVFMHYGEQYT